MLSEVANRCKINRSLPCYHDTCHLDNRKFLDIIEEYLSTDTLRSASTEPDTISFKHDSKEIMMIRRSDLACCVDEPEIMIHYFSTGKISRRVCDVFQKAGEAFSVRWAEYRTGAI
jgi:hypothetical protein